MHEKMTDVHSKEIRSYNMSRTRAKDTGPEMLVRQFLFAQGFRYRLHSKELPGKPDIYLPRYRTVIFVNGCFWHGHNGCRYFVIPRSRTEWWQNKIGRTQKNDLKAIAELEKKGLRVIIIWECDLKKQRREETLQKLLFNLREA